MVRLHPRCRLSFLPLKHFLHFAKRRQKMESPSVVNWVGKAHFLQSFCCLLNKCSQTQLFTSNFSSTRCKDEKKRFWQCILSECFKSYMYSCTCTLKNQVILSQRKKWPLAWLASMPCLQSFLPHLNWRASFNNSFPFWRGSLCI